MITLTDAELAALDTWTDADGNYFVGDELVDAHDVTEKAAAEIRLHRANFLTAEQREALRYVRDHVARNPMELCQDSVSKRHTAMVRVAVETIDALLAAPERTT